MNTKKCDRCGEFYIRKELKKENAVDIFGKQIFGVRLTYRGNYCELGKDVDLCPKCMNDLKIFMEIQHVTPYIAKIEEDTKDEDPCHGCAMPLCEQCKYGYKSLEERIRIAKENKKEI